VNERRKNIHMLRKWGKREREEFDKEKVGLA